MSGEADAAATLWPEMARTAPTQATKPTAVARASDAPAEGEPAPRQRSSEETIELFYGPREKPEPEKRIVAKTSRAQTAADLMWPEMDAANELVAKDAGAAKAAPASGDGDDPAVIDRADMEVIQLTKSVELFAPQGVELDRQALEGFAPIVDDFKIPSEAAQQLLELHAAQITEKVASVHKDNLAGFEEMKKQWRREFHSDPEIRQVGAENAQRAAKDVLKKHATPELRTYLKDFGLDDHPAMVKFLYRINQAIFAQSDRNQEDRSRVYQDGRRFSARLRKGG